MKDSKIPIESKSGSEGKASCGKIVCRVELILNLSYHDTKELRPGEAIETQGTERNVRILEHQVVTFVGVTNVTVLDISRLIVPQ